MGICPVNKGKLFPALLSLKSNNYSKSLLQQIMNNNLHNTCTQALRCSWCMTMNEEMTASNKIQIHTAVYLVFS